MAAGTVHPGRIRLLNPIKTHPPSPPKPPSGPVIYWMFRDQRCSDNWALIHAIHLANQSSAPMAVAFNLFDRFLNAHARQLGFMLRGLDLLRRRLRDLSIPFFLFRGDAVDTIPKFVRECGASALVTDFSPLRSVREWKKEICERVGEGVRVYEVDAHNVVPVWVASDKLEYGAKTIRKKIQRALVEYLVEFPEISKPGSEWGLDDPKDVDWEELLTEVLREGCEVPEIEWCKPGEDAAMEVLMGDKEGFLTRRLKNYTSDRNDPLKPKALSRLSPYLHFGQISAQRCALEARKLRKAHPQAVDAFLEELIVRRELADNFCYYQPHYDSLQGAWDWARRTLMDHARDKREHYYTRDELENAKTADDLWNASQLEMVHHGKMHGFMRMYWAKKILEWTRGPEEALAIAIYLNDKYEIDGRDPNGYVGCMWSICGVHDQGWKERAVFGKIRYMNYAGCKRKFDTDGYIAYVNGLVVNSKKRKAENAKDFSGDRARLTVTFYVAGSPSFFCLRWNTSRDPLFRLSSLTSEHAANHLASLSRWRSGQAAILRGAVSMP